MARGRKTNGRIVAQNRKARRDYLIESSLEAGIELLGSEVKSLRDGRVSLNESYAQEREGEIVLVNCYIGEYPGSGRFNHEPRRARRLLIRRREIDRLIGAVQRDGMTLVPLSIYFNERGLAKVELALARGKRKYEKRATIKEREWKREKARVLRDKS